VVRRGLKDRAPRCAPLSSFGQESCVTQGLPDCRALTDISQPFRNVLFPHVRGPLVLPQVAWRTFLSPGSDQVSQKRLIVVRTTVNTRRCYGRR
jgi:hypothetical protein